MATIHLSRLSERWLFGDPTRKPRQGRQLERDSWYNDEHYLQSRRRIVDETTRRVAVQEARLQALRQWFANPPEPPVLPEKHRCLACQRGYLRDEPGSTWRFCGACRTTTTNKTDRVHGLALDEQKAKGHG
jgi:hypothetical protein